MNAATLASFSGLRQFEQPNNRFPAAVYRALPESVIYDGSNRSKLLADRSGNSEVNCLALNGVAGNYASAPSAAYFPSGTTVWDVDAKIFALAAPAGGQVVWAKRTVTGNQKSINGSIETTGALSVTWSNDGTATFTLTSSAVLSYPFTGYVRIALNPNNGSNATANFYTSTDGTTWNALGVQQTTTASTVFSGTALFEVGSINSGTANNFFGLVYSVRVYSGLRTSDGTLVLNPNFATAAKLASTFTESSSNAATVTINTTGDTGARICGARDALQLTTGKQAILNGPGTKIDATSTSWSNGSAGFQYGTLTSANGGAITAIRTNGVDGEFGSYANSPSGIILPGVVYKLSYTLVINSGNAPFAQASNTQSLGALVAGTNFVSFVASTYYNGGGCIQIIVPVGTSSNYSITNIKLEQMSNVFDLFYDGSDDYSKTQAFAMAQPETVYFVGSQVTWTINEVFIDGGTLTTGTLHQSATTPNIRLSAGGATAENPGWALSTPAVITGVINGAGSSTRVNRLAAVTGNASTQNMNGVTVGGNANGSANASVTAREILIYDAAHDDIIQQRHERHTMRRERIAMNF